MSIGGCGAGDDPEEGKPALSIREEVQACLDILKTTNERLKKVRALCKHENGSFISDWSWRPGNIKSREICNDCRMPIDDPYNTKGWKVIEFDHNSTLNVLGDTKIYKADRHNFQDDGRGDCAVCGEGIKGHKGDY